MQNEVTASNFTTLMRIASPEQAAVSMSAALLGYWQTTGDVPVEIHLEGQQGIGKSRFVNGVCMMFWDEYVGGESAAAITKLFFDYHHAEHTKNGIRVIGLDEGQRRFGWSYAHEGSDPRSPMFEKWPSGKTVLFVENPCSAREFINSGRVVDLNTQPDIIVKFSYPVRQICQRLSGLDSSLGEPLRRAVHEGVREAMRNEWDVEPHVMNRLWSATNKYSKTSEEAQGQVRRAMSLRRVETSFVQSVFLADGPVVRAFIENEAPLLQASNGFQRLRDQALSTLQRIQICGKEW